MAWAAVDGSATVLTFRPRRLGVYLVVATRTEADGKTRTTSIPAVVVVRPSAGAEVRPEWVAPAAVELDPDGRPAAEADEPPPK